MLFFILITFPYLFTDIVTAYKNLKKEKEALESTLQILSSNTSTGQTTTLENKTKEVIYSSSIFFL